LNIVVVAVGDPIDTSLDAALDRYGVTSTRLSFGDDRVGRLVHADAIILDVGVDGGVVAEVCRAIRATSTAPIIVVSACATISDRIRALGLGADDYLTKPYDVHELMARVTSQCRRRLSSSPALRGRGDTFATGDVVIDLRRHSVELNRFPVRLTRKEFDLLALLTRSAGVVCTRRQIITEVWGRPWSGADNTLDVHVAGLRAKLGRTLIHTVRGLGYRLNVDDHESPRPPAPVL
jgi:DNA-binding response OmpR family regulator